MNDDDYAAALRQELDSLIQECEEARAARNKGRLLVEHLKAEQASLQAQKDQRLQRIRLLNELDFLQRQAEEKKLEKIDAVSRLVAAQQQYNQLLVKAGRCLPETVAEEDQMQKQRKSKSHRRQQQHRIEANAPPQQKQHCEPSNRSTSSEMRTKSVVHSQAASPRSQREDEEDRAREKEFRPQQSQMTKESKSTSKRMDSPKDDQRIVESSSGETRNARLERSTNTRRQTPIGQKQQQQQQQTRREAPTDNNNKNTQNGKEEQYRHSYTASHDDDDDDDDDDDGSNGGRQSIITSSALLNNQMDEKEQKDLANFMSACGYHSPSE